MNAHVIGKDPVTGQTVIINTIVVVSLDFMPGLVDASIGGSIGDQWDGSKVIPAPAPVAPPDDFTVGQVIAALLKKGALTKDELKGK